MPGYRHGIHGLSPGLEDTRVWKMYRRDCLEMFFLGLFSLYFFFAFIFCTEVLPGVWDTEPGFVQCLCSSKQTQRTEKRGGRKWRKYAHLQPNIKESVRRRGFGNEFLRTNDLRSVEGSPSPYSSSFFPSSSSPLPLGGSSRGGFTACRALSSGWGIHPSAHLSCPHWFSSGTWLEPLCFSVWAVDMQCWLPAGWTAPGPRPHSRSVSSFPSFPPFSSPLPSPPRWWKSSSHFPGLLKGEQEQLQDPISAFPILQSVEIPLWGNGVSDWL